MNIKKKKILFLTDDPRFSSGVATVSREIILNTCKVYDYIIVGGSVKHPEEGKIIDISESLQLETGEANISAKIYPVSGYGNSDLIRHIMVTEQPDVLIHFTDPRYWIWLYQMEHEIRQMIPITYLTIWDCPPAPHYNKSFYESCDLLMCISKQTYGLVHKVLKHSDIKYEPWQITYVPHGLNEEVFKPLPSDHHEVVRMRTDYMKKDLDYVILLNSRNIRRKQISDVIAGFENFINTLSKEQAKKCALVLHTNPVDEAGTNLYEVARVLAPNSQIVFSTSQLSPYEMNVLYNTSDVVINVSNNEGWGLSITEARLAGKPVIVNMTGGLQDQIGLKDDEGNLLSESEYTKENFDSNHTNRFTNYSKYAYAIIPSNISIQGSPLTPYIYDDRVSISDISLAMKHFYNMSNKQRSELGLEAREEAIQMRHTSKLMSESIIKSIDTCLEKWSPRKRFNLIKSK